MARRVTGKAKEFMLYSTILVAVAVVVVAFLTVAIALIKSAPA